jgi:hypothetical protein
LATVPFPDAVGRAGQATGNGAAASADSLPTRGRATSDVLAQDQPTRERVAGRVLARPKIRRHRGAGEGAARGRAGDGVARGEQGTTGAGDDGGNSGNWTRELTTQEVEGLGGRLLSTYRTPTKHQPCAEPRPPVLAWPDLEREHVGGERWWEVEETIDVI